MPPQAYRYILRDVLPPPASLAMPNSNFTSNRSGIGVLIPHALARAPLFHFREPALFDPMPLGFVSSNLFSLYSIGCYVSLLLHRFIHTHSPITIALIDLS